MHRAGDVVLANIPFADGNGTKPRPALILFEKLDNVVVAGMTSNLKMRGISVTKDEGAIVDSVIKLNYLFTLTEDRIAKTLFHLSKEKKMLVLNELIGLLEGLKD
jgi:mRNA interferase MazF